MALPPTIYKASIELSDIDRQSYQNLQTTLARHPSETAERVVLRLLAYALWYEEGLEFTRGICIGDEPDLWVKSSDDQIRLRIEVGLPDADRLLKAKNHCEHLILLASGPDGPWRTWQKKQLPSLISVKGLELFTLDWSWVKETAELGPRQIHWQLTRTEGLLYLTTDNQTRETPLIPLGE